MSCCQSVWYCTPDGPVEVPPDENGMYYPPAGWTGGPYATLEDAWEQCPPAFMCGDCEVPLPGPYIYLNFTDLSDPVALSCIPPSFRFRFIEIAAGQAVYKADYSYPLFDLGECEWLITFRCNGVVNTTSYSLWVWGVGPVDYLPCLPEMFGGLVSTTGWQGVYFTGANGISTWYVNKGNWLCGEAVEFPQEIGVVNSYCADMFPLQTVKLTLSL